MSDQQLSPTRPYLVRAMFDWICDNNLTPYVLVDATQQRVQVPVQYVQDGQIVLNLAPHAVHQFEMSTTYIAFSARFGGVSQQIYLPMSAVMGIYSRENGQGMYFDPEEYDGIDFTDETSMEDAAVETSVDAVPAKKKPSLRVLD